MKSSLLTGCLKLLRSLLPYVLSAVQLLAQAPAAPNPLQAGFQRIGQPPPMMDFADNAGFTPLFDGTLKGWSYDPNLWNIQDGSIHLSATCEKPTGTVYAVSTAGEFGDFMLKYEMKGTGNINSGMQFRSYITSETNVTGGPRMAPAPRPADAPGPPAGAAADSAAAPSRRLRQPRHRPRQRQTKPSGTWPARRPTSTRATTTAACSMSRAAAP